MQLPGNLRFEAKHVLIVDYKGLQPNTIVHFDSFERLKEDLKVNLGMMKSASIFTKPSDNFRSETGFSGPYESHPHFEKQLKEYQMPFYIPLIRTKKKKQVIAAQYLQQSSVLNINLNDPFPSYSGIEIAFGKKVNYSFSTGKLKENSREVEVQIGRLEDKIQTHMLFKTFGVTAPGLRPLSEVIEIAEKKGANIVCEGEGKDYEGFYFFFKMEETKVNLSVLGIEKYMIPNIKKALENKDRKITPSINEGGMTR